MFCPLALSLATLLLSPEAAATTASPAPSAVPPKAEILGTWKGTSTCTKVEGNEYCRNETVVYHFIDLPNQPATVKQIASRIVDDTEQPQYELFFTYHADEKVWSCEFERPRFRGVWSYTVRGDELTGTATIVPDNKIVRNVVAKRAPADTPKP